MSEIEKAKEALCDGLSLFRDGKLIPQFVVRDIFYLARAIAREEIEANEERLVCEMHGEINQEGGEAHSPGRHERPATGLDKPPPAVEAPAAGDLTLIEELQELCEELGCPAGIHRVKFLRAKFHELDRIRAWTEPLPDAPGRRLWELFQAKKSLMEMHDALHEAAAEFKDTTALARRLAEALDDLVEEMDIRLNRLPTLDSILFSRDVLAEARKAGLIE